VETRAPRHLEALKATLCGHERGACAAAIQAPVTLYRELREGAATPGLQRREAAERAALAYLASVSEGNAR